MASALFYMHSEYATSGPLARLCVLTRTVVREQLCRRG